MRKSISVFTSCLLMGLLFTSGCTSAQRFTRPDHLIGTWTFRTYEGSIQTRGTLSITAENGRLKGIMQVDGNPELVRLENLVLDGDDLSFTGTFDRRWEVNWTVSAILEDGSFRGIMTARRSGGGNAESLIQAYRINRRPSNMGELG